MGAPRVSSLNDQDEPVGNSIYDDDDDESDALDDDDDDDGRRPQRVGFLDSE